MKESKVNTKWLQIVIGLSFMAGSAFFLSWMSVFVELASTELTSMEIAFMRCLISFPVVIVFCLLYSRTSPWGPSDRKIRALLFGRGFAGGSGMILFYFGLSLLEPGDANTLYFTSPIWTFILGYIFLKEKCGISELIALVFTMCGIVLVSHPSFIFGESENVPGVSKAGHVAGVIACIAAAWGDAISYVFIRKIGFEVKNPAIFLHYLMFCTLCLTLVIGIPCSFLPDDTRFGDLALSFKVIVKSSWNVLLYCVGLACVGMLGQMCMAAGLQRAPAGVASVVRSLDVALVFIWQVTILHDPLYLWSVFGAVLVASGAFCVALPKLLCRKSTDDKSNSLVSSSKLELKHILDTSSTFEEETETQRFFPLNNRVWSARTFGDYIPKYISQEKLLEISRYFHGGITAPIIIQVSPKIAEKISKSLLTIPKSCSPYDKDTQFQFVEKARAILLRYLPDDVIEALQKLRGDGIGGILLIKGFDILEHLGPTPADGIEPEKDTVKSYVGEGIHLGLAALMGQVYTLSVEKGHRLIHTVVPVKKKAAMLGSNGANEGFAIHQEDRAHPFSPETLLLTCLRPDPQKSTRTVACSLFEILDYLTSPENAKDLQILQEKRFAIQLPQIFKEANQTQEEITSVLRFHGDTGTPTLCVNGNGMRGIDEEAERVLQNFMFHMSQKWLEVSLDSGDVLLLNNTRVAHTRTTKICIEESGRDRWLLRSFVHPAPCSPEIGHLTMSNFVSDID